MSGRLVTLAERWARFRVRVIPSQASEDAVKIVRRAYYAGAEGMLGSIMEMLGPEAEPTAQDLANMDALHNEIIAFGEALKRGEA